MNETVQGSYIGIILVMIAFAIGIGATWNYYILPEKEKALKGNANKNHLIFIVAVAAAFLLRIILSAAYRGHDTDMNCFIGWSDAVFENGIGNFYSLEMFHDYPPGYMYVLYVLGAINKLLSTINRSFGLGDLNGAALYVLIKLPAVLCDLAGGMLIYMIARKKTSNGVAAAIAGVYLFNPAAILNCSLWGQVDSVYTVLILLMIYCIAEKKTFIAYGVFALCIFVKPQAFIFTPIVLYVFFESVFLEDYSSQKLLKHICVGAGAIVLMLLLALPFGIDKVFEQYKTTLESYPYDTVNAFNLWGALGKNWSDLKIISSIIGYIGIAIAVVLAVFILYKSSNKSKYYFAGAVLSFMTYMLSTKMHDRYAFPAMILLLAAFAVTLKPRKYIMYLIVTLSQFFNTAWVLYIYSKDSGAYYQSPVVIVASIINLAVMVYIIYEAVTLYVDNGLDRDEKIQLQSAVKKSVKKQKTKKTEQKAKPESKIFAPSSFFAKLTRTDVIIMAIITAVYSGIALYDLGDMHAPETEYMLSEGKATIDLGQDYSIGEIKYYLGAYELGEERNLSITAQNSSKQTVYQKEIESGDVFKWEEEEISDKKARYITLSTNGKTMSVKEFAIIDSDGNAITPVSVTPDGANAMFDEQQEIPERSSFRNGTYFDEIYHARTGYEFVHGLSVYEWTHPPLGKVFIALGIKIFGMNPFGWRIIGTLFGIIMVPVIYIFARRLLKKTWIAAITCVLFTFDFMHFAQTRIATIDVYVTFFIMLMYYFMYKYYKTSFYDTPLKKGFGMLAVCGTTMGFAIASKWTGVYAAFGLLAIFCILMGKRFGEYRYALRKPKGSTDGISHQYIIDNFMPCFIKTILWCVVFFIIVPLVIYCLSYIWYLRAPDSEGLKTIWENQNSMLTYHADTVLGSTHPFSSKWYEWIVMKRPIWYYSGTITDDIKEGISSFGNPLVWWTGIAAFVYMIYLSVAKKDKNALFLIIAYVAQIFMWIPIERLTFIYHYFPAVPFVVLMIGYSIKSIYESSRHKKRVFCIVMVYAIFTVALFVMFYPVLSGQPCSTDYAEQFLKWFDSWVLL